MNRSSSGLSATLCSMRRPCTDTYAVSKSGNKVINRSSSIPVVARHSWLFLGYEKFSMFAFCPKATHFSYSHRNKSNHEEGGLYGTDYDGNEVVADANPGPVVTTTKEVAAIDEFKIADGQPDIKEIEGTFHTHPDLVTRTGSDDPSSFGTRTQTPFEQPPSPHDYSNATNRAARGSVKGNSVVLAQGNATAYIYNKDGLRATFPLPAFITIGIKK